MVTKDSIIEINSWRAVEVSASVLLGILENIHDAYPRGSLVSLIPILLWRSGIVACGFVNQFLELDTLLGPSCLARGDRTDYDLRRVRYFTLCSLGSKFLAVLQ